MQNASGSALGSGPVTLNGGTLAASSPAGAANGAIAGLVQAGNGPHTIAPGGGLTSSYGTLGLNGGLAGSTNTTLLYSLNLSSPAGTGNNSLPIYGGDLINLGGAGLSGSGNIAFVSNPTAVGDYRLFGGTASAARH